MNPFEREGIMGVNMHRVGNQKVLCPRCSHERRKSTDPCLSVDTSTGLYYCHHCNFSGKVPMRSIQLASDSYIPATPDPIEPPDDLTELSDGVKSWLASRGISEKTISRAGLKERIYKNSSGERRRSIAFPFYVNDVLVNIKYRDRNKEFRQSRDGAQVCYNLDSIRHNEQVIIVEGEMDVLSFMEAGFYNVISVPSGAPSPGSRNLDNKMRFVEHLLTARPNAKYFVLATDNDSAGLYLRDELARRLGKDRCYIVKFPEGCKDANDVLVKYGSEELSNVFICAKPYPVDGIYTVDTFSPELETYFTEGHKSGGLTGWQNFDSLVSWHPGELVVVTGIPGHGKSGFIANVAIRLSHNSKWPIAYFSPEHLPDLLYLQLMEIAAGKSLSANTERQMSKSEYDSAYNFVRNYQYAIMPESENFGIDEVLERAATLVVRHGIKMLILDPFNAIEFNISHNMSETLYIGRFLNQLKFFARRHGVCVVLVAHPRKMEKESEAGNKYKVPTLYSISGSANFYNIADVGIVVYRDIEMSQYGTVEAGTYVHVQKVKHRFRGKLGVAAFNFDTFSGRFIPQ